MLKIDKKVPHLNAVFVEYETKKYLNKNARIEKKSQLNRKNATLKSPLLMNTKRYPGV